MASRILIVDDEIDFLDIMSEFLEDEGYDTSTAINGNDALSIIKQQEFTLIISDINMPGMKGFELLHEVSKLYPECKRMLITAYDVRDYLNLAKDYNIGNIMTKTAPFNFDELRILIKNIISEDIFGLEKYIHGPIQKSIVKTSNDIMSINQQVIDFMTNDRHKRKFRQALGEIVINAFFYGARNERGDMKHAWDFNVELNRKEEVVVCWGKDDEKAAVSVTDQKGRLSKKDILYWLERNTTKGENGLSIGLTDCHGKGLFITRETLDRLIINIHPGKKTEIIMVNYEEGLFDGHRPLWIQEL